MKRWMHQAEKTIDSIIPPLLFLFLLLMAFEVFFPEQAALFKNHLDIFDTLLFLIIASDLFFKYQRMRSVPRFLKKYWLQIIAIIPFYVVFRFLEYFQLAEYVSAGEKYVNQTQVFGKAPALIIKQAERTEGISRTSQLLKFKPLSRLPHLFAGLPFFEKPTGRHHKEVKSNRRGRRAHI
ncbi:hypothetical protein HYY72_01150 [Candidatus Woesearchaeota archaeon]|nr:hypothetical protein [Candidatus Woesearchaeota archaeon]